MFSQLSDVNFYTNQTTNQHTKCCECFLLHFFYFISKACNASSLWVPFKAAPGWQPTLFPHLQTAHGWQPTPTSPHSQHPHLQTAHGWQPTPTSPDCPRITANTHISRLPTGDSQHPHLQTQSDSQDPRRARYMCSCVSIHINFLTKQ